MQTGVTVDVLSSKRRVTSETAPPATSLASPLEGAPHPVASTSMPTTAAVAARVTLIPEAYATRRGDLLTEHAALDDGHATRWVQRGQDHQQRPPREAAPG